MAIHGVLETCLYVDDLGAAEQFYTQVLGLTLVSRQPGRHVFLRCGQGMVLLFLAQASQLPGETPPHGAEGPGHIAFAVAARELDAWRQRLAEFKVAVEREVTWPGGQTSLYFRDPAGNSLELALPAIWGFPDVL